MKENEFILLKQQYPPERLIDDGIEKAMNLDETQ